MNEDTTKIVVAVGKRLEPGVAMNAALHALLGLTAASETGLAPFEIVDYKTRDADGFLASALPLIVLRASAGHLARLRADLLQAGLPAVAFHNHMTAGNTTDQLARSAARSAEEVELYAVATRGTPSELDPLTKRCSLY